jgi:hypothetical protein
VSGGVGERESVGAGWPWLGAQFPAPLKAGLRPCFPPADSHTYSAEPPHPAGHASQGDVVPSVGRWSLGSRACSLPTLLVLTGTSR